MSTRQGSLHPEGVRAQPLEEVFGHRPHLCGRLGVGDHQAGKVARLLKQFADHVGVLIGPPLGPDEAKNAADLPLRIAHGPILGCSGESCRWGGEATQWCVIPKNGPQPPVRMLGASAADRRVTRVVRDAAELVGVQVLDHVTVTETAFDSFGEAEGWTAD